MGMFDGLDKIARKKLTMFYLVDTSGSMDGAKIGELNAAMEDLLPEMAEISKTHPDAELEIAVLDFNTTVKWQRPEGPVGYEQYQWHDLKANGLTALGAACEELNRKLSKSHGFMNDGNGYLSPVFILLSDGAATDDFENGLAALKQNVWFRAGLKFAIAIGDDAEKGELVKFTGDENSVKEVHNKLQLKKMIEVVSLTSSQVASNGRIIAVDENNLNPNEAPDVNPAQGELNARIAATITDFDPEDVDF